MTFVTGKIHATMTFSFLNFLLQIRVRSELVVNEKMVQTNREDAEEWNNVVRGRDTVT